MAWVSIGKVKDKIKNKVDFLAENWSFLLSDFLSKNSITLPFLMSDEK